MREKPTTKRRPKAGSTPTPAPGHEPVLDEALATHEALRRLGFSPDDIFISWSRQGLVQVILRAQGKQFVVDVGLTNLGQEAFMTAWEKAVVRWNSGIPGPYQQYIWESSRISRMAVPFLLAMKAKGFEWSKHDEAGLGLPN